MNTGSRDEGSVGGSKDLGLEGGGTAHDETDELIASNKVEGTPVYDKQGQKLGSIHGFMVGKRSGKVAYAVMSFGGFLGMGESFHPLPWERLTYDPSRGGYVVDLDKNRLTQAPSFRAGEEPFAEPSYGRHVSNFYGFRFTGG
jgi:hypothetical protein